MILSILGLLAVQLAPEDVARAKAGEQLGRDLLEQGGCVILEGPPGKPLNANGADIIAVDTDDEILFVDNKAESRKTVDEVHRFQDPELRREEIAKAKRLVEESPDLSPARKERILKKLGKGHCKWVVTGLEGDVEGVSDALVKRKVQFWPRSRLEAKRFLYRLKWIGAGVLIATAVEAVPAVIQLLTGRISAAECTLALADAAARATVETAAALLVAYVTSAVGALPVALIGLGTALAVEWAWKKLREHAKSKLEAQKIFWNALPEDFRQRALLPRWTDPLGKPEK
jgi:hypothetical protein